MSGAARLDEPGRSCDRGPGLAAWAGPGGVGRAWRRGPGLAAWAGPQPKRDLLHEPWVVSPAGE